MNDVLIAYLANERRVQNERLLEALYVPVERRVPCRVVELAEIYPLRDGHVLISLTQDVLAELAGTSRATVNRILNKEERRGTVVLQRGKTLVVDRDGLERRAR